MLSILSDTQKAVVDTMTMRLSTNKSLEYLKDHGFEVSRRNYFRHKKKVQSLKLKRLYHIAKIGFEEQHLERIDQLKLIHEMMWKSYDDCKDAYQRSKILRAIADVQPLLSSYYDAPHSPSVFIHFLESYRLFHFIMKNNRQVIKILILPFSKYVL
jgi:hypothetical protein